MIESAYLAGVLDSDGSISIVRRKNSSTVNGFFYRVIFQLTWVETPDTVKIMKYLVNQYKGSFHKINKRTNGRFKNPSDIIKYSTEGKGLDKLLNDVLPFVLLKKEQVSLAIRIRQNRVQWKKLQQRTKPEEFWNIEHEIYDKFKKINSKNSGDR